MKRGEIVNKKNSTGATGKKAGDEQNLMDSLGLQPPSIRKIAEELNQQAQNHPIGKLQEIRAGLNRKRRLGKDIFSTKTIIEKNNYAFHNGGRAELQFNIGLEEDNSGVNFFKAWDCFFITIKSKFNFN